MGVFFLKTKKTDTETTKFTQDSMIIKVECEKKQFFLLITIGDVFYGNKCLWEIVTKHEYIYCWKC